jgi:hypothetical protein
MKKTSKKSKYDVVRKELNFTHSQWEDFYDYYDYDALYNDYYDFSYIKKDFYEEIISGPIFRRKKSINLYSYREIDMTSFYTKQERRNKFINELLGYTHTNKPTIGDIINLKNK